MNAPWAHILCTLSKCASAFLYFHCTVFLYLCLWKTVQQWICTDSAGPQMFQMINFCTKHPINLFFKPPIFFYLVRVCLHIVLSLIWKALRLAFIPATCQEWLPSVYQTKTVSCHLLKSRIHHPKISWSLSSTGNWHMRMKTAFYSEIIQQSCRSAGEMMCESSRWA